MSRPRNETPSLRWFAAKKQWCIYLNRNRRLLGPDKKAAEAERLRLIKHQLAVPLQDQKHSSANTGSVTLAEACDRYSEFAMRHYTGADRHRIRTAMLAAVADSRRANTPIEQFDRTSLLETRDELLARTPGLSRRYINHLIGAIKTAVTWMVDRRLAPASVLHEVRTVRRLEYMRGGVERPDVPPVDPSVVERTLPFCPASVQVMVRLQQLTGMRPGELVIMRRQDVSTSPAQKLSAPCLDRPVSAVEVSGATIWMYAPPKHKNLWRGKSRVIAIGPEAQKVLAPLLMATAPEEYVFRPIDAMRGARGKNMIRLGKRYLVRSYNEAIARSVRRANRKLRDEGRLLFVEEVVPKWFVYQLRHSLATDAADRLDAESAAILLGHSASRRALDSYVADLLKRSAEAAAKVG